MFDNYQKITKRLYEIITSGQKAKVILLKTLKRGDLKLSYVLVWRNDSRSPTHFYAPFPGQVSEKDFISFYNDPYTLFENDLKKIYK